MRRNLREKKGIGKVKKYKSTRCDLVTSSPTCPEQWDLLFQGIMGMP